MTQKVRVEYGRKVSENFDSKTVSGSIEVDLTENEHWQEVYDAIYSGLKTKIDGLLGAAQGDPRQSVQHANPQPQQPVQQPAFQSLPGENIQPKPMTMDEGQVYQHPVAQNGGTVYDIVPDAAYAFTNCKVFKQESGINRWGKMEGNIRIGNRDQIPGGFVSAKSTEAPIVARMKAIQEQEYVDVKGYFKPWKGNESRPEPKFDFIVQEINKTGAQTYATSAGPTL